MIDIGLTLVQGAASANNIDNNAYDYLVRMVVDKKMYYIHEKIILVTGVSRVSNKCWAIFHKVSYIYILIPSNHRFQANF